MKILIIDVTDDIILGSDGLRDNDNILPISRITDPDNPDIFKIILNKEPVINHTYKLIIRITRMNPIEGVPNDNIEIYSITKTYGDNKESVITEGITEKFTENITKYNKIEGLTFKCKYLPLDYASYN